MAGAELPPVAAQPDRAEGPVTGTVADKPFSPKSAYLILERDGKTVRDLVFLPEPGSCAFARKPSIVGLSVAYFAAGTNGLQPNAAMPVRAIYHTGKSNHRFGGRVTASDAFSVRVCRDDLAALPLLSQPSQIPDQPFSYVDKAGNKKVAQGGLIFLTRHSVLKEVKVLHALALYAQAPQGCNPEGAPIAEVTGILVDSRKSTIGLVQPAWLSKPFHSEDAYIRIDEASLKDGARVRGALHAREAVTEERQARVVAAGSFEARVCSAGAP